MVMCYVVFLHLVEAVLRVDGGRGEYLVVQDDDWVKKKVVRCEHPPNSLSVLPSPISWGLDAVLRHLLCAVYGRG